MKITNNNNERTLTITRNEMLEIAHNHNAKTIDMDNMYDICEIEENFPDEITISENEVGVTKEGFIIFKEDFEEIIKENTIMKNVTITKSLKQWNEILDKMVNDGAPFYILYGEIENKVVSEEGKQIEIEFHLAEEEYEEVKDTLEDIIKDRY